MTLTSSGICGFALKMAKLALIVSFAFPLTSFAEAPAIRMPTLIAPKVKAADCTSAAKQYRFFKSRQAYKNLGEDLETYLQIYSKVPMRAYDRELAGRFAVSVKDLSVAVAHSYNIDYACLALPSGGVVRFPYQSITVYENAIRQRMGN